MSIFSEDDDLDVVWAHFVSQCNVRAGWNLSNNQTPTVEGVLAKLNPPKKHNDESHEKTQRMLRQTLHCIDKFGKIAAQGTSMVFGPSQQCFNAISFVIGAVQDYDAVFKNVCLWMEHMSSFLERLRIYLDDQNAEEKVDKRLRLAMYRVLEHFMTTLAIWQKLTKSRTARLKLATKVAVFGEDEGAKSAMEELATLVNDYTRTQVSLTHKNSSETARDVSITKKNTDVLTVAMQRSENEREEQRRVDEIRHVMGIDKDNRSWERRQHELLDRRTANTGRWMLEYNRGSCSFTRWSDSKAVCLSVMSIVADGGCGKSVLASIVVDHLLAKYSSDPRICIAYYYLQRETTQIKDIIKAIVYQLAAGSNATSREYARLVSRECVDKGDLGSAAEVWKRFISSFVTTLSATFFIIIDGVDDQERGNERPLRSIIDQVMSADKAASLKIRLLITGRPIGLDALKDPMIQSKSEPIPSVVIAPVGAAPQNQDDILLHAQKRLDEMPIFQVDDESRRRLKARAIQELSNGVKGNFLALDSRLDSLTKCRYELDADEVISRAQESRRDEIARKIKHLDATLSEREKMEINELLMWTVTCRLDVSLDQCETILLLKMGTKVLASLETQIRNMYNFLFEIDENDKVLSLCAGIQSFLEEDRMSRAYATTTRSSISRDVIQDGEVGLMKRIIRTHLRNILGDDDAYTRFALDDFFESKRTTQSSCVHLGHKAENHLRVAQASLILVCDHHSAAEDYKSLQAYACEYFAYHLMQCEIAELDPSTEQEIGRKLIRILRDPTLIDIWWNFESVRDSYLWVRSPMYSNVVCRWLQRSSVQNLLQDMPTEKSWVLQNTGDGAGAVAILTDVAKRLAQRWHDLEAEMWAGCFMFVNNYLSNMHSANPLDSAPVQDILTAEQWAKKCLDNASAEVQWTKCMAETFREHGHWKEAIERYRKVIGLGQHTWQVHSGLLKSLQEDEQFEEAMNEVDELVKENKRQLAIATRDSSSDSLLQPILLELAQDLMDAEEFINAEKICKKILDESLERHEFSHLAMKAVAKLLRALVKQGKHHEMMRVFEILALQPEKDAGDWLCLLLHEYAGSNAVHDSIHTMARNVDSLDFIAEAYHSAIESARQLASDHGIFLSLRSQLAALLWSTQLIEDRQIAFQLWEANLEEPIPQGMDNDEEIRCAKSEARWAASKAFSNLTGLLMEATRSKSIDVQGLATTQLLDKLVKASAADRGDFAFDSHITELARLLHVMGDEDRARNMVRQRLINGFETIEDCPTVFKYGYWLREVASVLQTFDDEINAIAAWALALPDKDIYDSSLVAETDPVLATGDEQQAQGGAKYDADDLQTSSDGTETELSDKKPELVGPLANYCDGHCGKEWSYADNMWICKDCADVQFDPLCYEKLKNGTLKEKVCSPLHYHFYVPPFDRDRWLATPEDQMWVDGSLKPKKDWAEKIREEWKIDEQTLLAVKTIESSKVAGNLLKRRESILI